MTKSIIDFQDSRGRITGWPSDRRRAHQLAILSYLSAQLEGGKRYSEAELDRFLGEKTVMDDLGLLRRELVDGDYLMTDGEGYWKAGSRPTGEVQSVPDVTMEPVRKNRDVGQKK